MLARDCVVARLSHQSYAVGRTSRHEAIEGHLRDGALGSRQHARQAARATDAVNVMVLILLIAISRRLALTLLGLDGGSNSWCRSSSSSAGVGLELPDAELLVGRGRVESRLVGVDVERPHLASMAHYGLHAVLRLEIPHLEERIFRARYQSITARERHRESNVGRFVRLMLERALTQQ